MQWVHFSFSFYRLRTSNYGREMVLARAAYVNSFLQCALWALPPKMSAQVMNSPLLITTVHRKKKDSYFVILKFSSLIFCLCYRFFFNQQMSQDTNWSTFYFRYDVGMSPLFASQASIKNSILHSAEKSGLCRPPKELPVRLLSRNFAPRICLTPALESMQTGRKNNTAERQKHFQFKGRKEVRVRPNAAPCCQWASLTG